nr:nicotinamide riboside transporter PnuC [Pseudomonadota bacterium]
MELIEWIAAGLGLVTVALVVLRSVWNYPFAIAMVTLYFFVFLEAKLYSDALLQIFFLAINLYGWRNWLRSRREAGEVVVTTLSARERIAWAAGTAAASLAWGLGMRAFTDAAAPLIDAAIAGMSVVAQILLARRRIENWLLWILVDLIAIGLFYSRGLEPTAALYAVFLLMSVAGLVAWRRALAAQG